MGESQSAERRPDHPGETGAPLSVGVAIVLTLAALGALAALGFVAGVWARVGG